MSYLIKIITFSLFAATAFAGEKVQYYSFPENKNANLPFSDAVKVGDTLYLSGQIGIAPGESSLVSGGIGPETKQIFENIKKSLRHFGLKTRNIVKCLVMLDDITDWPAFNKVYTSYFSKPFPARSAFASSGLAFNAKVEVECIATFKPLPSYY